MVRMSMVTTIIMITKGMINEVERYVNKERNCKNETSVEVLVHHGCAAGLGAVTVRVDVSPCTCGSVGHGIRPAGASSPTD